MTGLLHGRAVIVTGAGGGLGRAHALALAREGAAVLVNDLGAARDGRGSGASPAETVTAEILASGGRAAADASDIATPAGAAAMAARCIDAFGRIDGLIANAGFLRDRSFAKLDPADFEAVVRVHLLGAAYCAQAVWPAMAAAGFGRIVLTTSAAGLYGNFGQSNYAAAKAGLLGLMQTLRLEGARAGIRINALAPVAATRMTEGTIPPEIVAATPPHLVSPAAVWLCAPACALDGAIVVAGGGYFALARIEEAPGTVIADPTPEAVGAALAAADWTRAVPHADAFAALRVALAAIGTPAP